MKDIGKRLLKSSVMARKFVRARRASTTAHPDWQSYLQGSPGLRVEARSAERPSRVLMATSVGAYWAGTTLESTLAAALTLRGAHVDALLCDGILPACLDCVVSWFPNESRFVKLGPTKDLCPSCFSPAAKMYRSLKVGLHTYSQHLTAAQIATAEEVSRSVPLAELAGYQWEGIPVGEHALAGVLRFFAKAEVGDEPQREGVARRYLKGALLAVFVATKLLQENAYDVVVLNHGIYVPQGLIAAVARRLGVRVVTWNPAYRKHCFIFSHQDTYHHTLLSEPTASWEQISWTPQREAETLNYLKSRWGGSQDWIWFHERPVEDIDQIRAQTGIDFSRPCIGMLTNVAWDAQLHYPANAFPNMLDWVVKTIAYFAKRPDVDLLLRIHPAEIRGTLPSRQRVEDEIKKAFPVLPRNVFVLTPQSQVSTYAAMSLCDSVIIYGTKTGVELTSMGIPVVVAGEAWIRGKGISSDAESEADYFRLLDELPRGERLSPEVTQRARKYAYHFFFRRMIPLAFMQPTGGTPPYRLAIRSIEELRPGRSQGLDVICEGILAGTEFIYRAETTPEPAPWPALPLSAQAPGVSGS